MTPLLALFFLGAVHPQIPAFTDRAASSNLSIVTYSGGVEKNHILESTGNGVLVLDYDRDGYQDLYFVNAYRFSSSGDMEPHANALYRNQGNGEFVDVTASAGVGASVYGQGGSVGDVDADGLPDIYVTAFGANILYRNNGDGTFTDITEKAGVGDTRWSIAASFFDADQDGDQDLFVANYIEADWKDVHAAKRTRLWRGKVHVLDGPKGLPGSRNTFYLNEGDGTFLEAADSAGFSAGANYYSMGTVPFDYDRDGDVDLYVTNDSTPNALYRNRGDGTFEEVGTETGCAYNADGATQGSMGVHVGDYDDDGWLDLVVTNFANDYYTLYRNLEGKWFLDETFVTGIAIPSFVPLGWGTFFFDADNDSDQDIFFSNGHIYPQVDGDPSLYESYRQRNQLLLNEGGKFQEVGDQAGDAFALLYSSRGAAYADLDNDGDLDVVVSNQDAHPSYLENRNDSGRHWVILELVASDGDPQALGARVELEAGRASQVRQIISGGSYASQNDHRLHFGLGDASVIDELVIRWPNGSREVHKTLAADRRYIIKKGMEPLPLR